MKAVKEIQGGFKRNLHRLRAIKWTQVIKLKERMSKNQPKKKVVRQGRIKHLLMMRVNKNLNHLKILKI